MQCYLCGVESGSKIGFIKRAHGLQLKNCCRTCEQYEHHSKPLKTIISSIWPFLACILMFWLLDNHSAFWVVINLIFLPLAMLPSIVAHELAHAFTAKFFGQNVFEIVVGQGKTLFEFKFKKVIISFKPILISGVTFFGPIIKKFFKLRMVLIVLAGPVTNLLIAECIRIFIFDGRLFIDIHTSFQPLVMLMYLNYLLCITNLFPFKVNTFAGKLWSDGGNAISIPFYNQNKVEELLAANYINKSFLAFERQNYKDSAETALYAYKRFPNNIPLKVMLGAALASTGKYDKAIEFSKEVLERKDGEDYLKAIAKNNIAWAIYLKGDQNKIHEADELSKQALHTAPWELSIRSTRASILVMKGDYKEAISLANDKRITILNAKQLANVYCVLASAFRGLNNFTKEMEYLDKAKSLDPQCILLAQIDV